MTVLCLCCACALTVLGLQKAKLFSSGRVTTHNSDWSVWTKTAALVPQPWAGVGVGDLVDHGMVLGSNTVEAQRTRVGAKACLLSSSRFSYFYFVLFIMPLGVHAADNAGWMVDVVGGWVTGWVVGGW